MCLIDKEAGCKQANCSKDKDRECFVSSGVEEDSANLLASTLSDTDIRRCFKLFNV